MSPNNVTVHKTWNRFHGTTSRLLSQQWEDPRWCRWKSQEIGMMIESLASWISLCYLVSIEELNKLIRRQMITIHSDEANKCNNLHIISTMW